MTKSTVITLGLETTIVNQNSPGYGDNSDALWQASANLTPITVPLVYSTGEYPAYGSANNQISPYVLLNQTGYRTYFGNTNTSDPLLPNHYNFALALQLFLSNSMNHHVFFHQHNIVLAALSERPTIFH